MSVPARQLATLLAAASVSLLAACSGAGTAGGNDPVVSSPAQPDPASPAVAAEPCNAEAIQSFVGQPESVLAATSFAGPVRILRAGDPMTEDFSDSRANFIISEDGRVERAFCG